MDKNKHWPSATLLYFVSWLEATVTETFTINYPSANCILLAQVEHADVSKTGQKFGHSALHFLKLIFFFIAQLVDM